VKLVSSPVSREMSRLCARPIRLFSRANISLTRKFTYKTVSTDSRVSLGLFIPDSAGNLCFKNICLTCVARA